MANNYSAILTTTFAALLISWLMRREIKGVQLAMGYNLFMKVKQVYQKRFRTKYKVNQKQ